MSSRTKKIIVATSIAILLGIGCLGVFFINARSFSSPPSKNEEKPIVKTLGTFRSISGTDFLIASVTGSNDTNDLGELFSSGRWFSRGYGYSQYNLVFLDVVSEAVYPLLATNDYEIESMEGFPKPVPDFTQSDSPQPTEPIAWWLFSIIKEDTNQDNELSLLDKQTLSISDVGGRGYTEIILDVDDLLGTAYKNDDTLLIIYRSNGTSYLAHIDLPSRQLSSTEELSIGEEIK